ncbi:hypothetical protein A2U01_0053243, partial [Trifolium medium]|nr:hypothetical protein [Trifolium medium]
SLEHCSIVISWGGLAFCHLRDAQLVLARCAVLCAKGGLIFWCLRGAQLGLARRAALPCFLNFLLALARRAWAVCAARSMFWSGLTFVDF